MESSTNKKEGDFFSDEVNGKEKRKLKAQRENSGTVWSGLGMFGMVGWSVAVPTLLGTALGSWLDKKHPVTFSWTLSCLIIGLFSGCMIAWYWISKNNKDE
jgi:ATP synthase protein I